MVLYWEVAPKLCHAKLNNELSGAAAKRTALRPSRIYIYIYIYIHSKPVKQKGVPKSILVRIRARTATNNESSWARAEDSCYLPPHGKTTGGRVLEPIFCHSYLQTIYRHAVETYDGFTSMLRPNTELQNLTIPSIPSLLKVLIRGTLVWPENLSNQGYLQTSHAYPFSHGENCILYKYSHRIHRTNA